MASIGASLVAASCLFVSPLDQLNESQAGASGDASAPDASGGSDAGFEGGAECSTHTDCVYKDPKEPWRCIGGECIQLTTPDCRCVPDGVDGVQQPWKDPSSIVIGAFASLFPSKDACGDDPESRNYRLAVEELNSKGIGGLPGPNNTRRPIALLLCDNSARHEGLPYEAQRDMVLRGTEHMAVKLKVPGILAHMELSLLETAFNQFNKGANPANVFFLTPGGTSNKLAAWNEVDDDGLLWHMLGVPGDVAPAYAALIPLLEQQLRTPGEADDLGAGTGTIRVLLLSSSSGPYEAELTAAIKLALSALKSAGTVDFAWEEKPVTSDDASLIAAGDHIDTTKPHVVLSTLGGASFYSVFSAVDKSWNPYYVLSPTHFGELNQLMNYIQGELIKGSTGYDRRFLGVNVAGTEEVELTTAYQLNLDALFPDLMTPDGENFYDSVYFMAYAMLGGGTLSTVFGRDIRDGMKRLSGQSPVFWVGIDPIRKDMENITAHIQDSSEDFLLMGTSGPADFDHDTGVRHTTASIYCFAWSGAALTKKDHVGHYDLGSGKLRLSKIYASNPPCLKKLGLPPP